MNIGYFIMLLGSKMNYLWTRGPVKGFKFRNISLCTNRFAYGRIGKVDIIRTSLVLTIRRKGKPLFQKAIVLPALLPGYAVN